MMRLFHLIVITSLMATHNLLCDTVATPANNSALNTPLTFTALAEKFVMVYAEPNYYSLVHFIINNKDRKMQQSAATMIAILTSDAFRHLAVELTKRTIAEDSLREWFETAVHPAIDTVKFNKQMEQLALRLLAHHKAQQAKQLLARPAVANNQSTDLAAKTARQVSDNNDCDADSEDTSDDTDDNTVAVTKITNTSGTDRAMTETHINETFDASSFNPRQTALPVSNK